MSYTEDQKKKILDFGALGYNDETARKILDADLTEEYEKIYEQGRLLSNYVIDMKLLEMAQQGDLKAIQKIEARKRAR